jgi:hypothetical protein
MCNKEKEMHRENGCMVGTVSGKAWRKKKEEKNEGEFNCQETDDNSY